jgi:hypothetical protein
VTTPTFIANRVGPVTQADGTYGQPRSDKTGAGVVTQAHGKYYEAAHRGVLFSACEQGTGIAPGTALGTTALLSLYNPTGSGKRLVIKKVAVGYISGTLGAGTLYHCVNSTTTQTAPSGGTLLTTQPSDVGNAPASVGVARVNSTVVQPLAYRPLAIIGAATAALTAFPAVCFEDVDGEIVIEPGCSYQLQAVAAAGTSPKVSPSVTWEEATVV